MKKLFTCISLFACTLGGFRAQAYSSLWTQLDNQHVPSKGIQVLHPTSYLVYALNEQNLKDELFALSTNPGDGVTIELPLPDGSYRDFIVWQTPMMPTSLAAKYGDIKTFTAQAVSDPRVTVKIDFTYYGFHAMIFDGDNTALIDPYSYAADGIYMCHYKRDEVLPIGQRMKCLYQASDEESPAGEGMDMVGEKLPGLTLARTTNGTQMRTYRLALAADNQFSAASTGISNPTKDQVFSQMTTDMNRINGVYEREFSITMTFVTNEDTLIFTSPTNDPYSADNLNPPPLLYDNQVTCDSLIGNANYDIGHVFTTGGGGLTGGAGIVCQQGFKAQCETGLPNPVGDGFTIDFVAHEMGHEYGGNHPFNNGQDGSCGNGNAVQSRAYEPGSGSTIMAYAGICSPDDIQPHSDPYFHAINVREIVNYTTTGDGSSCPIVAPTSNTVVALPAFTASYSIPYKTPFELTAPAATDTVADTLNTYCWEEWNRGDFGARLIDTHLAGPIFRSFNPDTSRTRVFPKLDSILKGTYSYAGSEYEDREGEKVPDTTRFLTFKLTVRDIFNGYGAILTPDDTIHLDVINTTVPFTVEEQLAWVSNNTAAITWSVASTNLPPISCDSVVIYLSTDGGHTWPTTLGTYANTGVATVNVPGISTSTARIKIKGKGNVFFNVNHSNFTIYPLGIAQVNESSDIKVFPVPATDELHITTTGSNVLSTIISNELGQTVWKGSVNGEATVSVNGWAKGVYYIQLIDTDGHKTVKPVTVE